MWDPMIPDRDWEVMSTVCIRFRQIRSLGNENGLSVHEEGVAWD